MADNVQITAGSGTAIAADDISSVWYQRVKLTDGTADATTAIAAGNGVHGDALRVTVASDSTGQVKLAAGTAEVGKLAAGSALIGSVKTAESGKTIKYAKVALIASQTAATVLDPTGGTKFVLKKMILSCTTAGDCYFFDSTDASSSSIGPSFTFAIGGGWTENWDEEAPRRSAATDNILKYTSGSGFTGSVYLEYWEE